MAGRGRNRRSVEKERFWRDAIERQRVSGLGVRPFCRMEGLAESSFHAWRRTLRKRDADRVSTEKPSTDAMVSREAFVPVSLIEERAAVPIEIVVPGGYAVRVADRYDAQSLRCVLTVLRSVVDAERPSC